MRTRPLLLLVLLYCVYFSQAQQTEIYPVHWWTGMKWNRVQLLVRAAESLKDAAVTINYPGIRKGAIHDFSNDKYISVDIDVAPSAKPGTVNIQFDKNGSKTTVKW